MPTKRSVLALALPPCRESLHAVAPLVTFVGTYTCVSSAERVYTPTRSGALMFDAFSFYYGQLPPSTSETSQGYIVCARLGSHPPGWIYPSCSLTKDSLPSRVTWMYLMLCNARSIYSIALPQMLIAPKFTPSKNTLLLIKFLQWDTRRILEIIRGRFPRRENNFLPGSYTHALS